jgi:hypothetical protein
MLSGVQAPLFILKVAITVHICKYSRVIDRYQGHLYDVGKRVVVSELCKVLAIVNRRVHACHRIGIGLEEVPIDSLSLSGSTKDVGFSVLDDEADEREGPEAFVRVEMSRMEWEEMEGIDIRADPWFPRVNGAFFPFVFSWWSWNKAW